MKPASDEAYLLHIQDCIKQILEYTKDGREVFFNSRLIQDAVIRNLEIIGEATKQLTSDIKNKQSSIPWKPNSGVEKVMLEHLSPPLIFCGDFNHTDIQNLYPNLFDKLNLLDALPNQPSVPNADMRIDYVLISKNDSQIVDGFIRPLMADHFPCLLELKM
jgi:uncharacterized protein with HEPN domain